MCQQRTALDMIMAQHDHGGMSEAALLLHQKQCEDTDKMNRRIDEIEVKLDGVDKKVDEIKEMISAQGSFVKNLKDVLSNKVFLYLLISLICYSLGESVGGVGTFLFR